jgi:acyl-CoA thioester hydrolase
MPMNKRLNGLGHFDGKTHILPISIYYEDTDLSGVVYHANYLIYFEVARVQAMKALGLRYAELEEQGLGLPVAHLSINYLKSAFYDQTLTLITQIKGIGTNSSVSVNNYIIANSSIVIYHHIRVDDAITSYHHTFANDCTWCNVSSLTYFSIGR